VTISNDRIDRGVGQANADLGGEDSL
jgi:hypothetical protein